MSSPLRSNSNRRIAERIGRAVAALKPDLMRPVSIGEAHPVVLCQLKAAARARIGHDLGARHSVGIELVIPRRVERVGPIHSLAVATDLYHRRTARNFLDTRFSRPRPHAAHFTS